MKILHKAIITFLLLYCSAITSYPQSQIEIQKQLNFRHITIDDGLSANRVLSICQDRHGYIWIGTINGLNRYNGMDFKIYTHNSKVSNALPSDNVYKVFCDSQGRLWIGTKNGLCYYDETKDGFIEFKSGDFKITTNVFDIEEDQNQNLWIATYQGIIVYSLESKLISETFTKDTKTGNLPNDSVYNLMIERNGNIWFACYDRGLCHLDVKSKKLKRFEDHNNPGGIPGNGIAYIFEDASGKIWIAKYNDGICSLNTEDSTFTEYMIDRNNIYTSRVRTIFEDKEDNLFFGTRGGLYNFDPKSKKFRLYADSNHKFSKLTNNSIICSYTDKNNGLWLGTHYGGINYADLERKPFTHYAEYENNTHFLNSSIVFTFAKDNKGKLYIGTERGLNIYDEKTNTFTYRVHNPLNENSLTYNDIKSVSVDKKGNLWIGTNLGGLDYYYPETGKFIHYKHIAGDSSSLLYDKIYNTYVDNKNNLWILSNKDFDELPSQLSLLKDGSRKFIHYYHDFYLGIYENSKGELRLGGINGFWLLDDEHENFTFIGNDSLIGKVYSVFEDSRGNIWAGCNTGLVRYNVREKSWFRYSFENGYPFTTVYGILEDNHLNIWISTNAGLIKMMKAIMLSNVLDYRVYSKIDGIQSKEFNYNAYYKSSDGQFYFGGIDGFNSFYPEKIKDNSYKPDIVISELLINNNVVPVGSEFNGRIVLKESINNTKRIKLKNSDKVFTIKFNALHYSNPEQNRYKYMLIGFDSDYSIANAYNNYVTYTDLPAGDYTFKVYALNYDGLHSDNPAEIDITIIPLFWQTWWFRIISMLLLITVSLIYAYSRSEKLRKQKRVLEKAVEGRTAELKKSYSELKNQQNEIIARNAEIQSQKEEIILQRDQIHKKNEALSQSYEKIKILGDFGQQLTSILNLEAINDMIFNYVSSLIDASVFGIGIYENESDSILFSKLMENGVAIPAFSSFLNDTTSCAAWCFKNQKIIKSNDFENDYQNFITGLRIRSSRIPKSLIYLPLTVMDKKIGIMTVQSYKNNVYTEQDLNTLQTLASYIAIALDNATAYDIVKHQYTELEKHRHELEMLVFERTKALEQAKEKAEESDKLKSAFLANMSHEIRTPLNAIVGFVNLLNEDQINEEEKRDFYQIIQSNGFTLLNLINDIIDFSKIEAGQMDISLSEIKLDKLFNEIYHIYIEETRRLSQNSGLAIQIKFNSLSFDKLPVLVTDYVRLKQIFCNLINNSIKFTREGYIEYGVKELTNNGEITFFVKDTGIGIEKKNFKIIFDRFRKVEDDKMTLYRGTGLGLSITKYLVERLGGEIWLDSEVGKGTEFIFTLPLANIEPAPNQKVVKITSTGLLIPNWSKRGVLVVEDENSNFMVIDSMLKKTNIEVFWAKNGEEAIDIFTRNKEKINLVLMDIKLPLMDGFEAAEGIKQLDERVPIIAQTAYALPKEEHLIRQENFDDYLSKPIVRDKLIRMMSQYLSRTDAL